ncbi:MAG: YeeE/YedE family protein [Verrucomicrobiales bacterium]|nr:YeeE/YedE family protein [Verrucomicrobiales bacterium]
MNLAWLRALVPGLLLGFAVSRLGFTDFQELHQMLLFRDLRLFLAFCAAAGLCIAGFAALRRRVRFAPTPFHAGIIPGAVLFGVGWAVTGACPGVVFAQLGQGILPALWSLAGVFLGTTLASRLTRRPDPTSAS